MGVCRPRGRCDGAAAEAGYGSPVSDGVATTPARDRSAIGRSPGGSGGSGGGTPWSWREPLVLYAAVLVVLAAVVWLGARGGPVDVYGLRPSSYTGSWLLGGWFRFDAGWYDIIAREGYSYAGPDLQSSVAFFPAYPLALAALHALTGLDVPLLGTLVTVAAGAGAVVLFHHWCARRLGPRAARTAVVVLVVYPYAWYLFGAVYADALFLAAVLGAFVLLEHDHPVWAGLVGAVATATRPVGAALVLGLVAVTLMRRHVIVARPGSPWRPALRLRSLRPADAGVLLSAAGLAGWMAYLWSTFGNPVAFQAVQQAPGWDQGSGPTTWFKVTFFGHLGDLPHDVRGWVDGSAPAAFADGLYTTGIALQAVLMAVFVALVVVVWRRIGWGYAVYAAGVIAVPLLGSKDFQGVGRYLLAAFPCLAAAALVLTDRPLLRRIWLPVSGLLLCGWAFAFARGYYVA